MPYLRGLQTDFEKDSIYREKVTLITEGNGSRNEWGEWLPGVETRRSVFCMSTPISDFDEDASAGSTVSNTRKFVSLTSTSTQQASRAALTGSCTTRRRGR